MGAAAFIRMDTPTPWPCNSTTGPRATELSDEMLVESARMGDDGAFRQLYDRHYRRSLHIACSVLRNREDAEDEVQNAFTQAWTHLDWFNRALKNAF